MGRGSNALAAAGLALAAGSAFSQALPSNASIQQGAATIGVNGAAMVVRQTTPRLVADWQSFSIGAANSVQFVQPSSASVALNRVTGNQASAIFGSLSANGHVYLQNPSGVLFAPGSQVNVGALVATTLQADLNAFRAGQLRLSGGEASTGAVVNQGTITTPAGGHVVLAGPQVSNAGSISTPLGTTALAAGNAVHVDPTGSGLITISVPVAAVGAALANSGSITADGGSVALHAAATDAALKTVMNVGGVVRARSIEQRDGRIVLSGGSSGVVELTGTLDASGGKGQHGGSVKVLGERVALLGNAHIDASGDTGGGTALVGGNYQGKGPEANALDTFVGAGARIDASAGSSGDGGTVVVWSDRTTTFKGRIDSTGGAAHGDGGMAEVSGKQLLHFGGAVDLTAARGKTGTLLLDPSSIDVGLVADVNGDATTGDDVTGNIFAFQFPGATSRITATQLGNLLFSTQVILEASSSITVSAPVTVAPAGPQTALVLYAPNVSVNAALDLNNTSLFVDTQMAFSDSIRINAPVRTNVNVQLTGSDIGIPSDITAASIYLIAAPGSASINSTGALQADFVIVTKDSESGSSVSLTGNNIIGTLFLDASVADVRVVQPVFNGAGFTLGPTNVDGNFTLNVSGTSVRQYDPGIEDSIYVGGQFTLNLLDPRGEFPRVFLQNGQNSFGSVVFNAPGDFFLDGSRAPLDVRGTAGGNITLLNTNHVTSLTGDIVSTGATGNTLVNILGVGFNNATNRQVIVQPGSRFVITSRDYTLDILGSIAFGTGLADINFVGFNLQSDPTNTLNVFSTNQNPTLVAPQSDLPPISRPYNQLATFNYMQAGTGTASFTDNLGVAARVINEGPFAYTATGSGTFAGNNDNTAAEVDKGYITNLTTATSFTGSSGTRFAGLTLPSYTRPPGPSGVNPVSEITRLALALSGIAAADKVYDGTTVATITGAAVVSPLSGDTVTVTGTPTANFDNKNVGSGKPVTVSGYTLSGEGAFNYTLGTLPTLFASITQATLAVTGIAALDKVYDTTTVATLTGTGTVTPFGSDVVTLGGSGSGVFNDKNVGTNKPVSVSGFTLGGADAPNYTLQQPSGVTASITQATLALSGLTAANKVYDATTVATLLGSAVATPLAGDTVTLGGTGSASFNDKNVGNAKPVTVTGYTLGGADAGNYVVGTQPGLAADITQATLAVTGIGALDKVYDTTTVATLTGSGTVTPFGSDVVTLGGSGSGSFNDKNVGTNKPVSVGGFTLGGADAPNYSVQQPSGVTASITQASLALSGLTAANKVYDATTFATLLGSAVATPLAGDAVTLSGTGIGSFNDKNVGNAKPVTVTGYTLGGADAANYVLGPQPGLAADITQRSQAVTGIGALDKVYDATTVAQLSGSAVVAPLAGDVVSASGSGTGSFSDKNIGTNKPVTVAGFTLAGADAANYLAVQPTGATASITAASLTVSGISVADKVYDATTVAALTGTPVAAPLGSDAVSIVGGSGVASFVDKNVGIAKPVTVTGYTLAGADAGNYTLGQPTGLAASITAAPLLISGFTVANKVYDGTTFAAITGASIGTAPFAGDTVAIGGGTAAFGDKNIGVNKPVFASGFTLSGPDAANYTVGVDASSSASITARPLTVAGLTALDKVYDSSTVAQIGGTPVLSNAVAGDVVALGSARTGSFADKNVGDAKPVTLAGLTLSGSDAGNYTLAQPAGLAASITPYALVVTGVVAADKVYDTGTVAMLSGTPTLTPFAGDVISFSGGGTGSFADKNVGLDKPVTITAAALTGPDAGNYRLVAPSGSLTADITARLLTPTGITAVPRGASSSTDVALDTAAASLAGVLPGDTVALVTSGATGSVNSPEAGINKTVAVTGLDLTGPDARNYALAVGANGLPNNSLPLLIGVTVTLFSPLRQVFEDLRDKEYLQGVSDAQEPFRRAMAEALAAGFGKENIRKQLQRGLVFETGPAAPAVDTMAPARKPASCSPARGANGSSLSCSP